jgi:hypothetical protein
MRRPLVLAFLASLLVIGCGEIRAERIVTGKPSAPYSGPVAIYMEGQPAPQPYEEVAIVQAYGSGPYANLADVTEGLKNQAQSVGATAVINVRFDRGANIATATGVAVRSGAH